MGTIEIYDRGWQVDGRSPLAVYRYEAVNSADAVPVSMARGLTVAGVTRKVNRILKRRYPVLLLDDTTGEERAADL
jgi:hypothetical protein